MRHRVGWLIPQQVLALTHFTPVVAQGEFMEIIHEIQACLQEVDGRFHFIIDNRNISSGEVATLETILQTMPQAQALPLGWIVMILSPHVQDRSITRVTHRVGDVQLRYVETLAEAFDVLQTSDASLDWERQAPDFWAAPNVRD